MKAEMENEKKRHGKEKMAMQREFEIDYSTLEEKLMSNRRRRSTEDGGKKNTEKAKEMKS